MDSSLLCESLPPLVSSFVDAFVDFTVSGIFLPTPDTRSSFDGSNPTDLHSPPTRVPAPARLVGIGDLHGDLSKTRQALSLAGIIDPSTDRWAGGDAVAVQVGDVLDRGGNEIRLMYLLHRLKSEAARSGGALLTMHGNHEVMNMEMDFRYVTPAGLAEFENWGRWYRTGIAMKALCRGLDTPEDPFAGVPRRFAGVKRVYWRGFHARIAALRPNGPLTRRFLVGNQAVIVVGDSVFVHGGLLEEHVRYGLERMNSEVREWVCGRRGRRAPSYMRVRDSLVWMRRFSDGPDCDCKRMEEVLSAIPAARMVMGHTIQTDGINAVCGDRGVRIDVGLSRGCGDGVPEVLEIRGGRQVAVLSSGEVCRRNGWPAVDMRGEDEKGMALVVGDGYRRPREVKVKA